jgi:hypothetical protein
MSFVSVYNAASLSTEGNNVRLQSEIADYSFKATTGENEAEIKRGIEQSGAVTAGSVTVAWTGSAYRVTITGHQADVEVDFNVIDGAGRTITKTVVTDGYAGSEPAWSPPLIVKLVAAPYLKYRCIKPVSSATSPELDSTHWEAFPNPTWYDTVWRSPETWVADKSYSPQGRGFPSVCAFHQQRLLLARTSSATQAIWGSRLGIIEDFILGVEENEPFSFDIDTNEATTIQWMKSQQGLILGTTAGIFSVNETGGFLSAGQITAGRETAKRSKFAEALLVDNDLLYIERGGKKLQMAQFNSTYGSITSNDISWVADHIGERKFKKIALLYTPEPLVIALLEDNTIAGLSYNKDANQLGWFQIKMQGEVNDIVSTYNSLSFEDELSLMITRTDPITEIKTRSIEKMPYPAPNRPNLDGCIFNDEDDDEDDPDHTTISGLGHLEGLVVTVVPINYDFYPYGDGGPPYTGSRGYVEGSYTVDTGRIITDTKLTDNWQWWVGLQYDATLETNELIGDGSWITTARRWVQLFLRLNKSSQPKVNGDVITGRLPESPMDEIDDPKSGDFVCATLGFGDGSVSIVQDQPVYTEVTSIYGQVEINNS